MFIMENNIELDAVNEKNDSETESNILFEGENEINAQRFGYDHVEELSKEKQFYSGAFKQPDATSNLSKWDSKSGLSFNFNIWGVTTKCNRDYRVLKKNELKISCALCLLETNITQLEQHNLKDYLDAFDKARRHKIPELWIYDYSTTYDMYYTDAQRLKNSTKFINNLL